MKWILIALAASFVPIWRDDMTGEGLTVWQYMSMAAAREHITAKEAIENYRRRKEYG